MWLLDRPIAHRGLHDEKATENSMAAFRNAIEKNYFIETDVHLLADGAVVAFHDTSLKRLCGQDVKISTLTTEDLKSDKYLLPNGENIPLFSELLELAEGKTKLLVELKMASPFHNDLEKAVYELIKGKEDSIAIQSFSPWIVKWFYKNAPEFPRGLLSTYIKGKVLNGFIYLGNIYAIKRYKPTFLAFNIKNLPAKRTLRLVKKHNLKLISWTVRSEDSLIKAKEINIDNIIFEKVSLKDNSYR